MHNLQQSIQQLVENISDTIIDCRKHLHQYPELSFQEKLTSQYLQEQLTKSNITFKTGYAEHGIIALIQGAHPGPCVAIRADMDALPIFEQTELPYASSYPGLMHACGHDVHMTCVLAAAKILNQLRSEMHGSVKVIFQPGEELLPGGASVLIQEGVLDSPKVDIILGQHVQPGMQVGHFGFCPGPSMASSDELYISIIGKGGHAAQPFLNIDPVRLSAQIITELYKVFEHEKPSDVKSLISIGKIQSDGGATNIIPERVFLEGTLRSLDESWREKAHLLIQRVIDENCLKFGATAQLEIKKGYPVLINDVALTEQVMGIAKEFVGQSQVSQIPDRLTAEDFAYYSHKVKACFYRLGVGGQASVHSPFFIAENEALSYGSGMMAYLVMRLLMPNT